MLPLKVVAFIKICNGISINNKISQRFLNIQLPELSIVIILKYEIKYVIII